MGFITNLSLPTTPGRSADKVMAGGTPANPAALAFTLLVGGTDLEVVVPVTTARVVPAEVAILPAHVVATAKVVAPIVA